jgi:hypothetical protein
MYSGPILRELFEDETFFHQLRHGRLHANARYRNWRPDYWFGSDWFGHDHRE